MEQYNHYYGLHRDLAPGQRQLQLDFADTLEIFEARLMRQYPDGTAPTAFTGPGRLIKFRFANPQLKPVKKTYAASPTIVNLLIDLHKHLSEDGGPTPVQAFLQTEFDGIFITKTETATDVVGLEEWTVHFRAHKLVIHHHLTLEGPDLSLNFADPEKLFLMQLEKLYPPSASYSSPPAYSPREPARALFVRFAVPTSSNRTTYEYVGSSLWILGHPNPPLSIRTLLRKLHTHLHALSPPIIPAITHHRTWFDGITAGPSTRERDPKSGQILPVVEHWTVKFRAPACELHESLAPGRVEWRLSFASPREAFKTRLEELYPRYYEHGGPDAYTTPELARCVTVRFGSLNVPRFKKDYTASPSIPQLFLDLHNHVRNNEGELWFNGITADTVPAVTILRRGREAIDAMQENWRVHLESRLPPVEVEQGEGLRSGHRDYCMVIPNFLHVRNPVINSVKCLGKVAQCAIRQKSAGSAAGGPARTVFPPKLEYCCQNYLNRSQMLRMKF
ncbi:hypothetical protein DFH06DRAFT_1128459 [Mycena polygramma]|nr:hypothetical protein DFH06DRAFT_1128459 [Mycena polygramma]